MPSPRPSPGATRLSTLFLSSLGLLVALTPETHAAADDESELPPLVRCFALPKEPAPPFPGSFAPLPGETISFLGGSNTFDQQKYPFLEILLSVAYPDQQPKFRNLVWQGDTVYFQHRPAFYYTRAKDKQPGSLPDERARTQPGILFITFGKMESLEGEETLSDFIAAYESLLDGLETRSRRIVIISPTPFFKSGPAAALNEERNRTLSRFAAALSDLAAKHQLLYVDTFTPLLDSTATPLTTDGLHLNEAGHRRVAEIVAARLDLPIDPPAVLNSPGLPPLRESIITKSRLWQQYYHPTNWAFLYGDRQSQPASRDHRNKNARWFIEEVKTLPTLIADTEADIHRQAKTVEARPGN